MILQIIYTHFRYSERQNEKIGEEKQIIKQLREVHNQHVSVLAALKFNS